MRSILAFVLLVLCVGAPTLASADWPAGGKVITGAGLNGDPALGWPYSARFVVMP